MLISDTKSQDHITNQLHFVSKNWTPVIYSNNFIQVHYQQILVQSIAI